MSEAVQLDHHGQLLTTSLQGIELPYHPESPNTSGHYGVENT
jgi:hypothetical protein